MEKKREGDFRRTERAASVTGSFPRSCVLEPMPSFPWARGAVGRDGRARIHVQSTGSSVNGVYFFTVSIITKKFGSQRMSFVLFSFLHDDSHNPGWECGGLRIWPTWVWVWFSCETSGKLLSSAKLPRYKKRGWWSCHPMSRHLVRIK